VSFSKKEVTRPVCGENYFSMRKEKGQRGEKGAVKLLNKRSSSSSGGPEEKPAAATWAEEGGLEKRKGYRGQCRSKKEEPTFPLPGERGKETGDGQRYCSGRKRKTGNVEKKKRRRELPAGLRKGGWPPLTVAGGKREKEVDLGMEKQWKKRRPR